MFKTFTVAAVLLISTTEAGLFGRNNKKVNNNVVKPGTKNGGNNFVGGKGQPNIDDLYYGADEASKLKKRIHQLAAKSVDDEADKFKEALVAVMTQRIQDYLKVKHGSFDEKEVKKIVLSTEFKSICTEQLADFKIDYKKFIDQETPAFIENFQKEKDQKMMAKKEYDFDPNSFNLDNIDGQ